MAELLQKTWWVPVIRGVIALLFGIFALVNPEAAGRLLIVIFGIYLLADGIFNIICAVAGRRFSLSPNGKAKLWLPHRIDGEPYGQTPFSLGCA